MSIAHKYLARNPSLFMVQFSNRDRASFKYKNFNAPTELKPEAYYESGIDARIQHTTNHKRQFKVLSDKAI